MTHTVLTISERAECSESTKLITCRYYEQNWWGSSVVGKDEAFFFFSSLKTLWAHLCGQYISPSRNKEKPQMWTEKISSPNGRYKSDSVWGGGWHTTG